MKALVTNFSLGREVWGRFRSKVLRTKDRPHALSIHLTDIPEPSLISPQWVKIRTIMSAISDMDEGMILNSDPSPLGAYLSFPFVPGNENLGIVTEVGSDVEGVETGERVVVDPLLSCRVRGINPPCRSCARGDPSSCENFGTGILSPGIMIGACRDTSGGWADYFIAHGSQLRPIPQDMESEQAILAPELTRALRAVLQHPPAAADRVIVVGAGSLGLLTLLALRYLGHSGEVMVVAHNNFEADLARKLGDAEVVVSQAPGAAYEAVAEFVHGSVRYPEVGRLTLQGGGDLVFETTGLVEHMEDALRFTREGKKLVLMAVNQPRGFNMTPLWYKDVEIRGSVFSGRESHNGEYTETFDIAMKMIQGDTIPFREMITHRFALSEFAKAFDVLADRELSKAIKVIFQHVV